MATARRSALADSVYGSRPIEVNPVSAGTIERREQVGSPKDVRRFDLSHRLGTLSAVTILTSASRGHPWLQESPPAGRRVFDIPRKILNPLPQLDLLVVRTSQPDEGAHIEDVWGYRALAGKNARDGHALPRRTLALTTPAAEP